MTLSVPDMFEACMRAVTKPFTGTDRASKAMCLSGGFPGGDGEKSISEIMARQKTIDKSNNSGDPMGDLIRNAPYLGR